jgi:predicted nucleic acid-binding protein
VSLYYADTSAVVKLLAEESHSKAFAAFYDAHAEAEWVSSALLRRTGSRFRACRGGGGDPEPA